LRQRRPIQDDPGVPKLGKAATGIDDMDIFHPNPPRLVSLSQWYQPAGGWKRLGRHFTRPDVRVGQEGCQDSTSRFEARKQYELLQWTLFVVG
jgi:hypothetical protein